MRAVLCHARRWAAHHAVGLLPPACSWQALCCCGGTNGASSLDAMPWLKRGAAAEWQRRVCLCPVDNPGPAFTCRSTWAGRSVIRSCGKLAYPHVQSMIEGSYLGKKQRARLASCASWLQACPC